MKIIVVIPCFVVLSAFTSSGYQVDAAVLGKRMENLVIHDEDIPSLHFSNGQQLS
ncbi:MAG: hypothetical protein ISS19_16705 [Bacteroidales bacterium]|nr:hypothetical protein [Bacteroidales bacterium]